MMIKDWLQNLLPPPRPKIPKYIEREFNRLGTKKVRQLLDENPNKQDFSVEDLKKVR